MSIRDLSLTAAATMAAAALVTAGPVHAATTFDVVAKDGNSWADASNTKIVDLKIDQGDTVRFSQGGAMCHNAVVRDSEGKAIFTSPDQCSGEKWTATKTFDTAGTFTLVCGNAGHEAGGMKATITVRSTAPVNETPKNDDTPTQDDSPSDTGAKTGGDTGGDHATAPAPAPATQIVTPAPAAAPADTAAPVVQAVVKRALSMRSALTKGIVQSFTVSEPGRIETKAYLPASVAKRLKIRAAARREVLVGKAARNVATAGIVKLRVKLASKAAKRLKRARSVSILLRTTVTDGAGNVKTITSRVKLAR